MATETLRPNAAGANENITNSTSGAGNHWQDVDEASPDDNTTKVNTGTGTSGVDTYALPDHSVGSGTINHVKVAIRCRRDGVLSPKTKEALYINGTVYYGTEHTMTSSLYSDFSHTFTINPDTGSAWDWAEIDALEAGVYLEADGGSWAYCTQVYVEVDYYTAVTPKTSSDTGSGVEGTPLQATALAGSELGGGSDSLKAKIEIPNKGGGTKLWT